MNQKQYYRFLRSIYLVNFSQSQARRQAFVEATAAMPF